jgi:uncharacterized protein YdgA (DUF945 family)
VKKGIVVILVLLAVLILVSPAIVGRLAEQSMGENLNWAAAETGDLKVTSERFARGWFSSEGQHRIELKEGDLLAALQLLSGPVSADDVPVLLINTRLDHGLIPVTSITRDKGSLAPGLGSAVSTMQVELPDGEIIEVPGTIYSKVGLSGKLHSNYVLEAGSRTEDGVSASWGNIDVDVTTDPASGDVVFDGELGSLSFDVDGGSVSLDALTVKGHKKPTAFGFSIGDLELELEGLSSGSSIGNSVHMKRMAVSGSSSLDGGRVFAGGHASMAMDAPPLGAVSYEIDIAIAGMDAAATGALQKRIDDLGPNPDPMTSYAALEQDAQRLFAAGFDLTVERLDVTLPEGTVTSVMNFSFGESDPASFAWSSLLLNTEASIDLSVPVRLVETYAMGSPQVAMAIGGGYLVRRGDDYVMEARLKKGLLTVNGAPIPIPLGTM